MSRLGKKPIEIPDAVKVSVSGPVVKIEGPKGNVAWTHRPEVSVHVDASAKKVIVERKAQTPLAFALHGTTRSLLAGMITGVSKGYEKSLDIVGVGYNAKVQGRDLILALGYSHLIRMEIPEGLTVTCPSVTKIVVSGPDKQKVGEFSARVRRTRPPSPYGDNKGVRFSDEVIRKKAGKTFVSGT